MSEEAKERTVEEVAVLVSWNANRVVAHLGRIDDKLDILIREIRESRRQETDDAQRVRVERESRQAKVTLAKEAKKKGTK